jgi:hypothetical protein
MALQCHHQGINSSTSTGGGVLCGTACMAGLYKPKTKAKAKARYSQSSHVG